MYLFSMQTFIVLSLIFTVSCTESVGIEIEIDDDGGDVVGGRLKVGQTHLGGIIAYIDASGQHGLIAAPEDQSAGIQWYNDSTYVVTGAMDSIVGKGKNNTNKIIAVQGNGNYAAKICRDLVLNGYHDWYLPSIYELEILYKNREAIGGFFVACYWSSTESSKYSAWPHPFKYGVQVSGFKNNIYRVRAVRTF